MREVLSADEHEVWELVVIRKYTSGQVASICGRTASAVRGIVLRAKNKLMEALADDE